MSARILLKPILRKPALLTFARCRLGAAAAEFALVLPAFILMVVGGIYAALMVFTAASLHFAVEDGARCASVQTTVCTDTPSTVAFTQAHYSGPSAPPPTFTYSATGCGHTMTGTVTYVFDVGLAKSNVPLSASACFP
jgi:Flp pilus assembly protein TadG